MLVPEALRILRPVWIAKVSSRLAKGEGTRQNFRSQLNSFYDLMYQSVETGDPAWMNSILDEWIHARTQTDLEFRENSVLPVIEQVIHLTYESASEQLEAQDALQVIGSLLPVFTHALGYITHQETNLYLRTALRKQEESRVSLERLDKSKSDFIAIAAHELKTPLTLIEGYSTMLQDRLKEFLAGNQAQILIKGIDNGTRRLKQIVDDMIDVSMIDNQLLALNYQPLWINRLLEMIQYEYRDTIVERKLTLQVKDFEGSQEMTFGDEERLYQALRNLISNAVKFTPDGGSITVDGRLLPGFLEITVADTGIGVDPQDHNRIFEKFGGLGATSLHSSGKTKFKGGGAGLGLPITKGIIEAHGGAIWVESDRYDESAYPGSIFHLMLPILKEPPDARMAKLFRSSVETGELKDPYE